MALRRGGDPLNPAHWAKRREPILRPVDGPAGGASTTGHNSFTTSPDGRESWIVYHARDRAVWGGVGDDRAPRTVRAQRFTWAPDGTPVFAPAAPSGVRLRRPSGG
jgi:GH43 family beta-xylosidase